MLTRNQFEVLNYLRANEGASVEEVAGAVDLSIAKAKGVVRSLVADSLVSPSGRITSRGGRSLAPYKVSNAIIMAAGMSSRFAPLSYEKPKGVLKVKGEILIERQIRQLKEAGITDITVVVGYKKEEFFYLQDKFGVDIVVNEDYYRYNNTSTLIRVLDKLGNTYVCSSDNYFTENVFEPYVYHAYYAATYFPGKASEWGIVSNKNGRITAINHAPVDMWCMMGHVYFDTAFSKVFKLILKTQYASEDVRKNLWEWLFEHNIKKFDMDIRKYSSDVIKEFDSLAELRAFDNRYLENTGSHIFKNICRVLGCRESEISNIEVLKQGLTNLSFKFSVEGKNYVYRHPGIGTENYISRKSEAFSLAVAKRLGLDQTVIHMDANKGWKVSEFIDNAHTLDYHNKAEVKKALSMMRKLHDARIKSRYAFDIWKKTSDFILKTDASRKDFADYTNLEQQMYQLYRLTLEDGVQPVLCHCDCYAPNFIVNSRGGIALIDWEYSGASDPGVDIGTFICCSDYTQTEADEILVRYHGHKPTKDELRHDYAYVALSAYYWFVWAVYQESTGNTVGEYLLLWYRMAKTYLKSAMMYYR